MWRPPLSTKSYISLVTTSVASPMRWKTPRSSSSGEMTCPYPADSTTSANTPDESSPARRLRRKDVAYPWAGLEFGHCPSRLSAGLGWSAGFTWSAAFAGQPSHTVRTSMCPLPSRPSGLFRVSVSERFDRALTSVLLHQLQALRQRPGTDVGRPFFPRERDVGGLCRVGGETTGRCAQRVRRPPASGTGASKAAAGGRSRRDHGFTPSAVIEPLAVDGYLLCQTSTTVVCRQSMPGMSGDPLTLGAVPPHSNCRRSRGRSPQVDLITAKQSAAFAGHQSVGVVDGIDVLDRA